MKDASTRSTDSPAARGSALAPRRARGRRSAAAATAGRSQVQSIVIASTPREQDAEHACRRRPRARRTSSAQAPEQSYGRRQEGDQEEEAPGTPSSANDSIGAEWAFSTGSRGCRARSSRADSRRHRSRAGDRRRGRRARCSRRRSGSSRRRPGRRPPDCRPRLVAEGAEEGARPERGDAPPSSDHAECEPRRRTEPRGRPGPRSRRGEPGEAERRRATATSTIPARQRRPPTGPGRRAARDASARAAVAPTAISQAGKATTAAGEQARALRLQPGDAADAEQRPRSARPRELVKKRTTTTGTEAATAAAENADPRGAGELGEARQRHRHQVAEAVPVADRVAEPARRQAAARGRARDRRRSRAGGSRARPAPTAVPPSAMPASQGRRRRGEPQARRAGSMPA